MQPIPVAQAMQEATNEHLGTCVPAPDRLHDASTLLCGTGVHRSIRSANGIGLSNDNAVTKKTRGIVPAGRSRSPARPSIAVRSARRRYHQPWPRDLTAADVP